MNLKKTIVGISALIITAGNIPVASLSAFADEGDNQTEKNTLRAK